MFILIFYVLVLIFYGKRITACMQVVYKNTPISKKILYWANNIILLTAIGYIIFMFEGYGGYPMDFIIVSAYMVIHWYLWDLALNN